MLPMPFSCSQGALECVHWRVQGQPPPVCLVRQLSMGLSFCLGVCRYRQDLQDSCRRMASALPMSPNRHSQSTDLCSDPFAELATRAPNQALGAEGQAGRDSPFTASASKVIIPRNPSSSSRASSALSHVSSRRSSRMRTSPNPFEVANGSGVIEEGNEEEEVMH